MIGELADFGRADREWWAMVKDVYVRCARTRNPSKVGWMQTGSWARAESTSSPAAPPRHEVGSPGNPERSQLSAEPLSLTVGPRPALRDPRVRMVSEARPSIPSWDGWAAAIPLLHFDSPFQTSTARLLSQRRTAGSAFCLPRRPASEAEELCKRAQGAHGDAAEEMLMVGSGGRTTDRLLDRARGGFRRRARGIAAGRHTEG